MCKYSWKVKEYCKDIFTIYYYETLFVQSLYYSFYGNRTTTENN